MKSKSLKELLNEHADLERDSKPMIDQISERSKQALELQREIFLRRFKKDLPEADNLEAIHLTNFSARENPAKFDQLMAALREKQVTVTQVVYDPMNFTFCLYGKAQL